jgi:hypothetical protein
VSNNLVALIVAIVGVLGTLTAAVLTQFFTLRSQREQRREEIWSTALKERRDSCIALSVEARRFQQALRSYLSTSQINGIADVEEDWQSFVSCYSEARVILPKTVTRPAANAFGSLKSAYESVLEANTATGSAGMESSEREELIRRIDKGSVREAIRKLRDASRDALGSDLPLEPPRGL